MTSSENISLSPISEKFVIESKASNEVSIKWKIEKFSATKADERRTSREFFCGDAVWNLVIYPNGRRALKNVGHVLMYLAKVYSLTSEHTAVFKFDVIDNQKKEVYQMSPLFTKCKGHGKEWLFCALKRYDILKKSAGILSLDTLTVSFELTITNNVGSTSSAVSTDDVKQKDEEISEKCKHCLNPLSGDFESLYYNPRFSDVTINLASENQGTYKFPAHKVVLASRSRVFEAMFEHDMKESRNSTVDLIEMGVDTARDMLRYMYCRKTRKLSSEDTINLYIAADRYDLQELLSVCQKIMVDNLSIDNICDTAVVADLHDDKSLTDAVESFLLANIKQVLKSENWKIFSKEKPDLSVKLLESVILNAETTKW